MDNDISKDCWQVGHSIYNINKISRFGISSLHIKSDDVVCFREADILIKADIHVMISLTLKIA